MRTEQYSALRYDTEQCELRCTQSVRTEQDSATLLRLYTMRTALNTFHTNVTN